jgi:hypothetical protein
MIKANRYPKAFRRRTGPGGVRHRALAIGALAIESCRSNAPEFAGCRRLADRLAATQRSWFNLVPTCSSIIGEKPIIFGGLPNGAAG